MSKICVAANLNFFWKDFWTTAGCYLLWVDPHPLLPHLPNISSALSLAPLLLCSPDCLKSLSLFSLCCWWCCWCRFKKIWVGDLEWGVGGEEGGHTFHLGAPRLSWGRGGGRLSESGLKWRFLYVSALAYLPKVGWEGVGIMFVACGAQRTQWVCLCV